MSSDISKSAIERLKKENEALRGLISPLVKDLSALRRQFIRAGKKRGKSR